jgi:hypothetical protein
VCLLVYKIESKEKWVKEGLNVCVFWEKERSKCVRACVCVCKREDVCGVCVMREREREWVDKAKEGAEAKKWLLWKMRKKIRTEQTTTIFIFVKLHVLDKSVLI